MSKSLFLASVFAFSSIATTVKAVPAEVFFSDFNAALPGQIAPGFATLTGVQGYAGLGPVGNQFGGNFLRSPTGNTITLSLMGLPSHDTISLKFLFAAIDSLDGTGSFPAGDFFKIVFDGNTLFSESFANALPTQIQSYVPPSGVELARHASLGFTPGGDANSCCYSALTISAPTPASRISHIRVQRRPSNFSSSAKVINPLMTSRGQWTTYA